MKFFLIALVLGSHVNTLLGCFVARGDCPNENVTFWLYSNETRNAPKLIDPVQLNPSDFQLNQTIEILIHGYTGHRDHMPISLLRNALLDHADVSVITVDYGKLAPEPCYLEAVHSLPLISKCLGQLINNLIKTNLTTNDRLHLIGFSLGGQLAGQTANYVSEKLAHITGLDPAKPLFVEVPESLRLDRTDAQFVDVIHADTLELSVLSNAGHADFYPNFGQFAQPGCEKSENPGSCSHLRSLQYYAESISSAAGFWGSRLEQPNEVALMGYRVPSTADGSYFLSTASKQPFAMGQGQTSRPELRSIESEYVHHIEMALEKMYLEQEIKRLREREQEGLQDSNIKAN